MREITRSVKVALKCLFAVVRVDVGLPCWTSEVEHLVAFAAIFSNISLRISSNGYLGTFGKKFRRFGDVFHWFLHFISWTFAVFLLPVYFTYCAKFEVDMAIHCRVIAFLLLIHCVTLWPWLLAFWPWPALVHGGSRDQHCQKLEDTMPIRSWVMSYNVFHWLLLKMRFKLLRMHRITWPVR